MNLTDICIRRPLTAWVLMFAIILFGLVALSRIGVSQLPDVDFPVVNVELTWQGAAPEAVEHDVVDVVEDALVQVEGINAMTSTARQGGATVTLELDIHRDVDVALQDVQAKLSQAQLLLPKDMDPPVVQKLNPEDFPIMWISVSGAFPRQMLADWTRYQLKDHLQAVPGVGGIQLGGLYERNVRLWFDRARLDERGITIVEALDRLKREHLELPAGRLETPGQEVDVRIYGEALDLGSLRQVVVGGTPDHPVHLDDVALVEDGFADIRSISRNNGIEAQALGVKKQRGENAVAVAERVKKAIVEIQKTFPPGMAIAVNYDATVFVGQSVHEVERELILSVVLTSFVCLLFLGSLSATFNVVLAIPMSILGTIAVIQALGWTLNTFTLLALALVVGIVVDDAIMVQENITRHLEAGLSPVEAARRGTRQIAFAALAATVAVIAIFLPVVFMTGVIGRFLMQFGVALCVAVAFSYLEAVTLAPARCAQFMAMGPQSRNAFGRFIDAGFAALRHGYAVVLRRVLLHPILTLVSAVLLFFGSFWFLAHIGYEMTPSQDQSALLVRIETSTAANIDETSRIFARVERYLNSRKEVAKAFSIIGGFGGTGVNAGVIFISLVPPGERALGQNEFAEKLHRELDTYAGCKANVQDLSKGGFNSGRGYPVEFSLRGNDWPGLTGAGRALMARMAGHETLKMTRDFPATLFKPKDYTLVPADVFSDIDTDYQLGKPELAILPDRARVQDLGISVDDIATAVNSLLGSVKVGKFAVGGRRIDVRAGVLASDRQGAGDLADYRIRAAGGALVPLSTLVTLESRSALQTITHKEHARAISIYANVRAPYTQADADAVLAKLRADLPPGVALVEQGSSAQLGEAFQNFAITFLLGLAVAWLILAAQFNSLIHPFTVLTILPLAIAGAAASLWLGGFTLNMFSVIGMLLLMGIVKKNSIILVDYAEKARAAGASARDAIQHAGEVRLRPILMTSAATMMAAVPTALGLGAGSETRQPMAVAVFGGVLVSTLLSLAVVPAFYLVAENATTRMRTWFGMKARPITVDAAGVAAAVDGLGPAH
jgi:hydrophobe/amphiphile efflux-1 (HAE1) family protein